MATLTVEKRGLSLEKVKSRITKSMAVADAVKEIVPVKWSDEVLSGKKKAVVKR